jgi:hypothetical protein
VDAFESLISMLLRHDGYWTTPSFKVELTKEEKVQIGKSSSPRWEIDLLAYKGATNEVLAVECKSFLDSRGVTFRNGRFETEKQYKLFSYPTLRAVVLKRLARQLRDSGACPTLTKPTLCLAIGKIANVTNRSELKQHFDRSNWLLFDPEWVFEKLSKASEQGYENDVAFVVSKLLLRNKELLKKYYGE